MLANNDYVIALRLFQAYIDLIPVVWKVEKDNVYFVFDEADTEEKLWEHMRRSKLEAPSPEEVKKQRAGSNYCQIQQVSR